MPIQLAAAAPIIGAAVDAIGNVGGGLFSINQARKNRKFQERMYQRQLEDNRENWRMQNEYNLPINERQRLEDAGLNPLLMYGQGGISSMATSPAVGASAPHGAQAQADFRTNFGQALYQAALMKAQIENIEANTDKTNAETSNVESQTTGQDFMNWLNDNTRSVQLALKYRDYDYVNSVIDKNRNEVFQSSFRNSAEVASLSLMNSLAIRRQNLSEYEVGENIKIGWQNVANGKIQANASLKTAFANMMNAVTAARVSNAQIGLMRAQAANYNEQTRFLKGSFNYRLDFAHAQSRLMQRELSWYDITREAGLSEQQQRTFMYHMSGNQTWNQTEWMPFDKLMTPINMLTGFGAGMLMNGNFGRVQVRGFGQ